MTHRLRPAEARRTEAARDAGARRPRRRRVRLAAADEFGGHSREFMYEFCEMMCKVLPGYSQRFNADLTKVLIVNALAAANVQRLMASPQRAVYADLETWIPGELQVPVNALSLAETTGLPRETVRRKLKELLSAGLVMEDERGGYRLQPGAIQAEHLMPLYYASFKALGEVIEACLDAGLIEVEED
jgi:DNA-binding transcriptional ArsR family regulator